MDKKPSVFIKIASLDDSELTHTIENAVKSAKYPERLHFGIFLHFSTDVAKQELEDYLDNLSKYSRFSVRMMSWTPEFIGVGAGRYQAESMYEDEDYVLQIDSHTWFCQDWDELLIGLIEGMHNKTILTGYAPPYISKNGIREPRGKGFLLPVYTDEILWCDWFLNWTLTVPKTDAPYIPNKFCANFAFGTKEWGKYSGLNKKSIFWSEEPLQTRNLKNAGFDLLLPNIDYSLICHLYDDDIEGEGGKRMNIEQFYPEESKYLMEVADKEIYFESVLQPHSQSSQP